MKLSAATALAVLITALLLAGCGGSGSGGSSSTAPTTEGGGGPAQSEGGAPKKATAPNAPAGSKVVSCSEGREEMMQLRATAVDCDTARTTMQSWERSHECTLGKSGSRSSCSLGGFRCQAVRVDRGASVSCVKQGADVAFIAKAWRLKKSNAG
jgi:hypothetical protein